MKLKQLLRLIPSFEFVNIFDYSNIAVLYEGDKENCPHEWDDWKVEGLYKGYACFSSECEIVMKILIVKDLEK